jgi:hypothetical protein
MDIEENRIGHGIRSPGRNYRVRSRGLGGSVSFRAADTKMNYK